MSVVEIESLWTEPGARHSAASFARSRPDEQHASYK